jgi:hypothetical protein
MPKWIAFGAAVCCTALALLLPWARYGGTDVSLYRFPAWYVYVAAALTMHGCVLLRSAIGRTAGLVASLTAAATAVLLLVNPGWAASPFGDADSPIPAVAAGSSVGPLLALAGVLANAAALAPPRRTA